MRMNQRNKLIIFVKNEEAGKTKTRLAATIGDEEALEAYRRLLTYTFSQAKNVNAHKEVWYSRYKAEDDIWASGDFNKKVQSGEDLGKRMSNAFEHSFKKEKVQSVVVIGSDCAELKTEIIEEAYSKLKDHDFVVGPAEDGGDYLLGMSQFYPDVFEGIEWSTESVFDQTVKKIEALDLNLALLQTLNDVDNIDDWNQVKDRL